MEVWAYAEDPKLSSVAPEIRQAYESYMKDLPEWGDILYLSGELEAGLYEIAVLKVVFKEYVSEIFLIFTVNCSDRWLRVETYIQACRVTPPAGRQELGTI